MHAWLGRKPLAEEGQTHKEMLKAQAKEERQRKDCWSLLISQVNIISSSIARRPGKASLKFLVNKSEHDLHAASLRLTEPIFQLSFQEGEGERERETEKERERERDFCHGCGFMEVLQHHK